MHEQRVALDPFAYSLLLVHQVFVVRIVADILASILTALDHLPLCLQIAQDCF